MCVLPLGALKKQEFLRAGDTHLGNVPAKPFCAIRVSSVKVSHTRRNEIISQRTWV